MKTPQVSRPIKRKHIVPIIAALILAIGTLVAAALYSNRSQIIILTSTPTIRPTSQPTASTPTSVSKCPLTANQVAQLMGVQPVAVTVVREEPCAFKLDAKYTTSATINQAHCASGYGYNSVEMERVQPHRYFVFACTGNDETALQAFYEAVVRFENWQPSADACSITQQHWLHTDHNIDFPQGCPVPN